MSKLYFKENKCQYCFKIYSSKNSFVKHIKTKHSGNIFKKKNHVMETFKKSKSTANKAFIEFHFDNIEEFEIWKKVEEDTSFSRFVKLRGQSKKLCGNSIRFNCHRSGFERRKASSSRKNKESRKINAICPAFIKATIFKDQKVLVFYNPIHENHVCDPKYLPMRKEERAEIANFIREGLTFDEILNEICRKNTDNARKGNITITKTDLKNISKEFNLCCDLVKLQTMRKINNLLIEVRELAERDEKTRFNLLHHLKNFKDSAISNQNSLQIITLFPNTSK